MQRVTRATLLLAGSLLCVAAAVPVARRAVGPAELAAAVRALVTPQRLEQHARAIVEHERLSGSAGENAAIDYIVATLRADGVPVKVDTFLAYTSDPISAKVELVGTQIAPRSITVAFSATVRDLEAPLVDVGDARALPELSTATGERLALAGIAGRGAAEVTPATGRPDGGPLTGTAQSPEQLRQRLTGAIALVTGTPGPDEAWTLQQLGAVGAVFVNPQERLNDLIATTVWGTPSTRDAHRIPQLAVAEVKKSDGDAMRQRLAAGPVRVRLTTETKQGWKPLRLAVARVAGPTPDAPYVLFGGHIDAWYHGANDEGASNSAMLELARAFHKNRAQLRRGLVVAWWPGHSNGRYAGSTWFVDRYFTELRDRAIAYLNVDGIGQMGAKRYGVVATPSLAAMATGVVKARTGVADLRVASPGRNSDQSFNGIGMPLLQFDHSRLAQDGGYWWWHTPDDTFDKIDFQILKGDADLYIDAIAELLAAPVPPIDVAATVGALGAAISQRQNASKGRFDLSDAMRRQARLLTLTQDLQRRLATGTPRVASGIDLALVRILRPLHRVSFTLAGEYHPDPAVSLGSLPGLAEGVTLATESPDSDRYRFAEAALIRERNRLIDALDQSIAEAERLRTRLGAGLP